MSKSQPCMEDVNSAKKLIRQNICDDRTASRCCVEETDRLKEIVKRVVQLGESDSVLIVGPVCCGKTVFVQQTVNEVIDKFGDQSLTLVQLNGLVHTNDNLALQEIIRSLHVQDLPEASLISGSFADNLSFVLQSFKSGNRNSSKPIVFVIDEFEYFCEHKNQTLLYNLFDVAQSAQAPLCVIGITPRIDITELFEKRVKSRFSQRQITLSLPTDFKFLLKIIESIFTIKTKNKRSSYISKWNDTIESMIKDKNFIKLIKKISEFDINLRWINSMLFLVTSFLKEDHPFLVWQDFEKAVDTLLTDCKIKLIKDLSVLELCLVVTMKHHCEIYDYEPLNFEMIYQRYMKFAVNSTVHAQQYAVVFKAFERLKEMEVIIPLTGPGKRVKKKEYILYTFVLTDQQIKEALISYENLPTDLSQWASSSYATV